MTQHEFGNSGRYVNGDWHAFRAAARREAFSEEEFDPIQRERYDLETAGITGEANPDTYTTERFGRNKDTDRRDDPLMD